MTENGTADVKKLGENGNGFPTTDTVNTTTTTTTTTNGVTNNSNTTTTDDVNNKSSTSTANDEGPTFTAALRKSLRLEAMHARVVTGSEDPSKRTYLMTDHDIKLSFQEDQTIDFNVVNIQKILKLDDGNLEGLLQQAQERLTELKKKLVFEARKNFMIEREVELFGNKIRLLIRNHINAEDMRSMLDNNSFDKLKSQPCIQSTKTQFKEEALLIYEQLFYVLRTDPKYLSLLTCLLRGKQIDSFLQTVVFTLFGDQFDEREENLLLQLFENLLTKEFDSCNIIGEFMRSNTVFTKMLNAMLRRSMYHQYILKVLKEPIQKVLNHANLNLDINPARLLESLKEEYQGNNQEMPGDPQKLCDAMAKERIQFICEYSKLFLKQIYSSVKDVPYGVRYICKKILQNATERYKSASSTEIFSLVGGFVFLRFINPAIITCDTPEMRLSSKKLSKVERNNLTIICKTLQNLSNGIPFGSKEHHMTPFNSFLQEQLPSMQQFFAELCKVDDITAKLEMDKFVELSKISKSINISHNEISFIHELCEKNLDFLCPSPSDPIRALIQKLSAFGSPPAQLPKKQDYFFNLKLTDPERESVVNRLESEGETLEKKARLSVSQILRQLPKLPSDDSTPFISLVDVLNAAKIHATQKEDFLFANRVKDALQMMEDLEKTEAIEISSGKEKFTSLLKGIYSDTKLKAQYKEKLEIKNKVMDKVLRDVSERHEYLKSQLELYKKYLEDTLSKTYTATGTANSSKTSSSSLGSSSTIKTTTSSKNGSNYTFKMRELVKNGVISTPLPKPLQKTIKVIVSCTSPGNFLITANSVECKIELSDLLEKQAKSVKELEFNNVKLNVDLLILLLNKLFVCSVARSKTRPKRKSSNKRPSTSTTISTTTTTSSKTAKSNPKKLGMS